ncbi:uncharacterized protein LOC127839095 [Dreissena polymorpha]|uniref:Uncharacterized protein n=1 Tax=Dreissena polymorpha TaxID=45954 RepID=A0A9D4MZG9_DREPO|nr:uncharacterized protein LOC127839095 [Dreissena polymorpha]KAH3885143.1 hypothetical protein DPMN_009133 [Dreissena polymorpha]
MALLIIAGICIGLIHSASAQGSYYGYSDSYYRGRYGEVIMVGAIGLSFSILCLICIFVGLICVCAKKCCRQTVQPAPGLAFVNAVPSYMPYGQSYFHGQPVMHNQPAMHGQPLMHGQPDMHGQPVMHGQPQQTFNPSAPSAAS